ncbi:exo-alpha-sialidase [Trypanosoma cruzi]|nr:exo-alpha-sialidase [Trypanosoma cruzi]
MATRLYGPSPFLVAYSKISPLTFHQQRTVGSVIFTRYRPNIMHTCIVRHPKLKPTFSTSIFLRGIHRRDHEHRLPSLNGCGGKSTLDAVPCSTTSAAPHTIN